MERATKTTALTDMRYAAPGDSSLTFGGNNEGITMRLILFALLALPCFAYGQNLESTFGDLAKELAAIQGELVAATKGTQQFSQFGSGVDNVTVTSPEAPVYSGAALNSRVIKKLGAGVNLRVVDKAGEWYAVDFEGEEAGLKGFKGGWLMAADVIPIKQYVVSPPQTAAERAYDQILEKVRNLKEKYSDNPYVRVTGFDINISVPPALSIGFEFKQ